MLKDLDQWAAIRRGVLEEGMTKRQMCRTTGLHWTTLQRILAHETPPAFKRHDPAPAPAGRPSPPTGADGTGEVIDRILRRDRFRAKAMRHTPELIRTVLRAEHGVDLSLEAV